MDALFFASPSNPHDRSARDPQEIRRRAVQRPLLRAVPPRRRKQGARPIRRTAPPHVDPGTPPAPAPPGHLPAPTGKGERPSRKHPLIYPTSRPSCTPNPAADAADAGSPWLDAGTRVLTRAESARPEQNRRDARQRGHAEVKPLVLVSCRPVCRRLVTVYDRNRRLGGESHSRVPRAVPSSLAAVLRPW